MKNEELEIDRLEVVYGELVKHGKPMSREDIFLRTHIPRTWLYHHLNAWVKDGVLARTETEWPTNKPGQARYLYSVPSEPTETGEIALLRRILEQLELLNKKFVTQGEMQ